MQVATRLHLKLTKPLNIRERLELQYLSEGRNAIIYFCVLGSPLGCADQVLQGSEPNEHGTWLYGRDGWCDGQNVRPWVVDVTADVTIGALNSVRYQGYFRGKDPDPKMSPGVMIIASYLVLHEQV